MSDPSNSIECIESHGIQVARVLYDFVNDEALPGTGVVQERFWSGLATLIRELSPRNAQLLRRRDQLQQQIDAWHHTHPGPDFDAVLYRRMLEDIGYLQPEGESFSIDVQNVDAEIASIAGPQLVVPVDNARYAIHAANARWGSLYDALYGTDAISEEDGAARTTAYNPIRGAKVIAFARAFLDQHFPLIDCSHRDVASYTVSMHGLSATLQDGRIATLLDPSAFVGFQGNADSPRAVLLVHHKLHVDIQFDRDQPPARDDAAGVSDILLESAITTIQDCEDSVAAVDADDKVRLYRNWLGLMNGTLQTSFNRNDRVLLRTLNPDRRYKSAAGTEVQLPGRSLMLVRNVGQFMMSDAVTLAGRPVPEALIDAAVTALIGKHDLLRSGTLRNSRRGSIYIVKPKMHGAEEVAFANDLFERVEDLLQLSRHTIKIGIMDEERRTTLNLKECIRAARRRVVFINTGFLDRTGSEIHTSMEAGPVMRKNELRKAVWLDAYERQNVDIGLLCGLSEAAQIGKGMWAMPDQMAAMLASKLAHPLAGASTSWVPSPTAATLHALHYHQVDVAQIQVEIAKRPRAALEDILRPPLAGRDGWKAADIAEEIDNNVQSILGYVVRWIDLGIGCSKVPDYYDTALMEDRATLRISSQHLANWLRHGVCTAQQIEQALRRMASVVDEQNSGDPSYQPMSANFEDNIAFATARDLVFKGREQPDGYTETILHARRRQRKAMRRLGREG